MKKSPKERTSKKVASKAAKLLDTHSVDGLIKELDRLMLGMAYIRVKLERLGKDIKSVAGSALTQREK